MLLGLSGTSLRTTSIRLGNVLGSEGSVVPLFLDQIARGGPVTVTDPNVERYFLTTEDTVRRILRAAATIPDEPTVAVPVMGEAIKIADLARYLIQQSGVTDIQVTFTGLRPGDKLKEEFVSDSEFTLPDTGEGLQWVRSPGLSPDSIATGLAEFSAAMSDRNLAQLLATLTRLVPEYQPSAYLRGQVGTAAH
jgi:FlaA1/EpsC-like NDP-sugar epimerase